MSHNEIGALQTLLGDTAEQLSAIQKLDASDRERLAGLIQRAQQSQASRIEKASEEALNHIPRLLRGTVRKLLF